MELHLESVSELFNEILEKSIRYKILTEAINITDYTSSVCHGEGDEVLNMRSRTS